MLVNEIVYMHIHYEEKYIKHNRITELEREVIDLKQKNDFYDKYVVFVSPDVDADKYHHLGCEDFDTSSFVAYNVKQAEYNGYSPCSKCCE